MAAEAAQKRHERALEREQQYERTAQEVEAIWAAATPTEAHPYLAEKGVVSHGLRVAEDGRLLMPARDADGRIWSLQHTGRDGFKQFHESGRVDGGHYAIGNLDTRGPLLIAEGNATAATVYDTMEMPVIVAFNAGNLAPTAQACRERYPDRPIYIAGDNDHQLEAKGKPNAGRETAEQSAAAIGGFTLLPTFTGQDSGSDWNDLVRSEGRTQRANGSWRRSQSPRGSRSCSGTLRTVIASMTATHPTRTHSIGNELSRRGWSGSHRTLAGGDHARDLAISGGAVAVYVATFVISEGLSPEPQHWACFGARHLTVSPLATKPCVRSA